jgi:HK97 family phage prohead protease
MKIKSPDGGEFTVDRVYSKIEVKEVDDERREFAGIASTPSTDRHGDIVEPKGADFRLPLPLLWQHDRMSPVGTITFARATKNGIEVKASIPRIPSPSGLAARLEEAWQSLKHGLVRGLSIGFSPIEFSFMDSGGVHFTKWDWHELSLVTIPANADATITSIKAFDAALRRGAPIKLTQLQIKKPSLPSGAVKLIL